MQALQGECHSLPSDTPGPIERGRPISSLRCPADRGCLRVSSAFSASVPFLRRALVDSPLSHRSLFISSLWILVPRVTSPSAGPEPRLSFDFCTVLVCLFYFVLLFLSGPRFVSGRGIYQCGNRGPTRNTRVCPDAAGRRGTSQRHGWIGEKKCYGNAWFDNCLLARRIMGRLIKNHWARLIVLSAAMCRCTSRTISDRSQGFARVHKKCDADRSLQIRLLPRWNRTSGPKSFGISSRRRLIRR